MAGGADSSSEGERGHEGDDIEKSADLSEENDQSNSRQSVSMDVSPRRQKGYMSDGDGDGDVDGGEARQRRPLNKLWTCQECFRCYHMGCISCQNPFRVTHDTSAVNITNAIAKDDFYCDSCQPRPVLGTTWIPLMDIDRDHGVLGFMTQPHTRLPGVDKRSTNCRSKNFINEVPLAYFNQNIMKDFDWHIGTYKKGDFVLFDATLVHATSTNRKMTPRLSIDSRWYLMPRRRNCYDTHHGQRIRDKTIKVEMSTSSSITAGNRYSSSSNHGSSSNSSNSCGNNNNTNNNNSSSSNSGNVNSTIRRTSMSSKPTRLNSSQSHSHHTDHNDDDDDGDESENESEIELVELQESEDEKTAEMKAEVNAAEMKAHLPKKIISKQCIEVICISDSSDSDCSESRVS